MFLAAGVAQLAGSRETSPTPVLVTSDSVQKEAVLVPERQREPGSRRVRSPGCNAAQQQGDLDLQQHIKPGALPFQQAVENGDTTSQQAMHTNNTYPLEAQQDGQATLPGEAPPGLENLEKHTQQAVQVGQGASNSGMENGDVAETGPHAPYRRSRNAPRVKAFKLNEKHIAGQNLLKFHLRPPTRRGCFDDGALPTKE